MKIILSILFISLLLFSCSQNEITGKKLQIFGVLGHVHDVKLADSVYLTIPEFFSFIFFQGDTVFGLDVDKAGNRKFYYLSFEEKYKIYTDTSLNVYRQMTFAPLKNHLGDCGPDVIYLDERDILSAMSYENLKYYYQYGRKHIVANRKIPVRFLRRVFEMDSRFKRHYLSNEKAYRISKYSREQLYGHD